MTFDPAEQHYQHFTKQLAQMTLTYLHNLLKDGAKLLEVEDNLQDSSSDAGSTPFQQEIQSCLESLTESTVKLRCLLSNMPVDNAVREDFADGNNMSFLCVKGSEENRYSQQWDKMTDEVCFTTKKQQFKTKIMILLTRTLSLFSIM